MSTTSRILYHRAVALSFHDEQKYGDLPYEVHLEQVKDLAVEFNPCFEHEDVCVAAYYHDVLEDTPLEASQLEAISSSVIAEAVWACTDAPGKNRHERKHGTDAIPGPYKKLQNNELGLYIKLCDRLANVRASKARRQKFNLTGKKDIFTMYQSEQAEFESILRKPNQFDDLWEAINQEFNS